MTLGPPTWLTGSWAVNAWADGTWFISGGPVTFRAAWAKGANGLLQLLGRVS